MALAQSLKKSLPHKIESTKGQGAVVSLQGEVEIVTLHCQAQVGDYVFVEEKKAIKRIAKKTAEEILGMLDKGVYL